MVIKHYGGQCHCCGENRIEFLAIDHVYGNGGQHNRRLRQAGTGIVDWLIKNNYPEGFRVLCHNCNMALGFYGYCPHKQARRDEDEGA